MSQNAEKVPLKLKLEEIHRKINSSPQKSSEEEDEVVKFLNQLFSKIFLNYQINLLIF